VGDVTPPELTQPGSVIAISGGFRFAVVLKSDLSVVAFGSNDFNQTAVPEVARQPGAVKAIAAGKWHSLALLSNGTVIQWGRQGAPGVPPPEVASGIVSIHANDACSFAISQDGTAYGWGEAVAGIGIQVSVCGTACIWLASAIRHSHCLAGPELSNLNVLDGVCVCGGGVTRAIECLVTRT
jgi:hypothetical protein